MNFTKNFILKNLLKLRDIHGGINTEAIDNLVDSFRDELREMFEADEVYANYEGVRKEEKFEEYAREQFLSIITR